jgi:predicted RNase H-like HicB family nuclease
MLPYKCWKKQAESDSNGRVAAYIAFIHRDPDTGFAVGFPDLPGLWISAPTMDRAWEEAEVALPIHLRRMIEEGEAVPAPSTLDMLSAAEGYRDALAVVAIHAAEMAAPTVLVNIAMSEAMLRAIDEFAAARGFTRAGFLVQAARKALEAA